MDLGEEKVIPRARLCEVCSHACFVIGYSEDVLEQIREEIRLPANLIFDAISEPLFLEMLKKSEEMGLFNTQESRQHARIRRIPVE